MKIKKFSPNQDYDKRLQSCLEEKLQTPDKLFEDDEFPPNSGVLYWDSRFPFSPDQVDWLRPGEICHEMGYPGPEMVVAVSYTHLTLPTKA